MATSASDLERAVSAIMRTLKNYPNISRSMLSVHVRPLHPEWTAALDQLVDEGRVVREAVLRDSGRASVIYRLSDTDNVNN